MIYVEAPNYIPKEYIRTKPSVFLAGGITGCPDWQKVVVEELKDLDIIILNPRRVNFDVTDPNASYKQIGWEHQMLEYADLISYWFAKETIQPIVLFELGKYLNDSKRKVIGIHPEYPRRTDVEIQTTLVYPEFEFVYSLGEHILQIKDWVFGSGGCPVVC